MSCLVRDVTPPPRPRSLSLSLSSLPLSPSPSLPLSLSPPSQVLASSQHYTKFKNTVAALRKHTSDGGTQEDGDGLVRDLVQIFAGRPIDRVRPLLRFFLKCVWGLGVVRGWES